MEERLRSALPDLKEALARAGVVASEEIQKAIQEHGKDSKKAHFLDVLLESGKCDEKKLVTLFCEEYGYRLVSLKMLVIHADVLKLIPRKFAEAHGCLPVSVLEKTLTVAIANPTNLKILDELQVLTGKRIRAAVAEYSLLKDHIKKFYLDQPEALAEVVPEEGGEDLVSLANMVEGEAMLDKQVPVADLMEQANQAPVVKLVNMVLVEGVRRRAKLPQQLASLSTTSAPSMPVRSSTASATFLMSPTTISLSLTHIGCAAIRMTM